MRLLRVCLSLCLILSLLAFAVPAPAVDLGGTNETTSSQKSDQILVKFKHDRAKGLKGNKYTRHKCRCVGTIPELGVDIVKVPAGSVAAKVKEYQTDSDVEYAEPDSPVRALGIPNDTYFSRQWGMTKIDAPNAWNITQGRSNIKIAILDTGVDQNHEDIKGKIVSNKKFSSSYTVDDLYGHGTHVAGIAAAVTNNAKGVAGGGYTCTIMNGKVLGDDGSGYYSWVANGIIWAANNGAKVINMSLGGSQSSSTLQNAVNYAWNKGVVIVAAAGNSNNASLLYPAAYTNCIAVAATDSTDNKSSFSSYGSWVDVAAPGTSIFSTLPNHSYRLYSSVRAYNYGYLSGTSMASPHVAALAGLIWATTKYGTGNSSVRSRIQITADKSLSGNIYSTYKIPRINDYKAVAP